MLRGKMSFIVCLIQSLSIKKCPISSLTLPLLAETASELEDLNIDNTDSTLEEAFSVSLMSTAEKFQMLKVLNISWNLCEYS